ncbi:MAG: SH3 domain-containing protein [Aureispira sp.]
MRFFSCISFIFFAFVINFSACQEAETPIVVPTADSVVVGPPPRRFMRTKTTRLRMRQTPDLEGAVLQILQESSFVEFLYDSTQFTTTISYNQQQYNSNWYKIMTDEGQEGWVYAAFVEFLDKKSNKKIITQKETAALLEAANQQQSDLLITDKEEDKQGVDQRLLNNYQDFLQQLDAQRPSSISSAIGRYKAILVDRSTKRTHDAAYAAFRKLYHKVLIHLQKRPLGNYQHLKAEIRRYKRAYMKRDLFTQELANNGFNFGLDNDKVVIVEDVDFLYRVFYREVSTPMRAFMNQYQLETPNFWWQQNELMIPPKELARWILSWNYFVATYPDFMWYSEAKKRLSKQLTILLQGSPSTPAFEKTTEQLKEDYQKAYLYITENYPDSKIGRTFQEYVTVLENNDWTYSSIVSSTQQQLLSTLLEG